MPADDLTDPAPAAAFAHLDATTVLSRQIAELGIYPVRQSTLLDDVVYFFFFFPQPSFAWLPAGV